MAIRVALLLSVVAGATGCGDAEDPVARQSTPTASATPAAGTGMSRERVIEALGVTRGRDANGVPNSDRQAGCYAFKIFAAPEDNMRAYIQIGDPVATNPSKTVGAVVGTYKGVSLRKCIRLFERRLVKLG